jgi:hypothetical protein
MKNFILNALDCTILACLLWFALLGPAVTLATDDLNARSLSHARWLYECDRATEEYNSSEVWHFLALPRSVDATPPWPDHCGND